MRASTFLLLVLGFALMVCAAPFVAAQEEAVTEPIDSTIPDEAPVTETPADDKSWKSNKLSGLAIGENAALAVPVPILVVIFLAFLGAVGYGVFMILDSDKQRERKAEEAKAKRAAKDAKKGSKKK